MFRSLFPVLARSCLVQCIAAACLATATAASAQDDPPPGFRILGEEGSQAVAPVRPAAASKQGAKSLRNAPSGPGPFGQNAGDYIPTFVEEFDTWDPTVWNDHIWYERSNPTKNFAVENGVLKIWPQRDAKGEFFNRTLDTDRKFKQLYGYFEMEAKLPRGKGVWPAFWLLAHPDEKRRPEIDIMEAYPAGEGWGYTDKHGMQRPNVYGTTVWIGDGQEAQPHMYETHTDLSAGFHKYAVKWEPNKHTFYFDGKPVHVVEGIAMKEPMYILLDLWYGSAAGNPDDTTPTGKGNAFEVKYVRAWQFRHRERH